MKNVLHRVLMGIVFILVLPAVLLTGIVCILSGLFAALFCKGKWENGTWAKSID